MGALGASLPRTYWYVWWGTLVNRLGGFVVPLLSIYLTTQRGLGAKAAGLIGSCFGAGGIAAALLGGHLADRIGRRATMVLSMLLGALAMLALGRSRELGALAGLVVAVGFFGALYRPAVAAFVADIVPPAQRVRAYGLLYWAVNIGFAFAATVGGWIADVDFSILFYADALTSIAFGVIVAAAVPETRPTASSAAAGGRSERSAVTDVDFLIVVAINFMTAVIRAQVWAPLAIHMTGQGFSPATYGTVMAVNGLVVVLFQPLITRMVAPRDPSRILALSALLYGIGMATHGIATAAVVHAAAVLIWTLAEISEAAIKPAMVAAMAPPSARGTYQGVFAMSWGMAQVAGPPLGTWLWQEHGPAILWNGCLAAAAIVAGVVLATAPARRRRLASGAC